MTTSRSSGSDAEGLRQRAVASLARGERTRRELTTLLSRHADAALVDSVVRALTIAGLQSDVRAAEIRARRAREKGHAAARARSDLVAAGVEEEIAGRAIDEAYADGDEQTTLRTHAARLLGAAPSRKDALRVARTLVRRGYAEEDVLHACGLDDLSGDA